MDTGGDARHRKYLSLGAGEVGAAAVFAATALLFVTPRLPQVQDRAALWSVLVPLLVVPVPAGLYWLLARTWVERVAMPRSLVITYRVLRIALLVLLTGGLVGVVTWWPNNVGVAVLVAAVWVFGAVEYANYFVVRLAYPVSQWFTAVREWRTHGWSPTCAPRVIRKATTWPSPCSGAVRKPFPYDTVLADQLALEDDGASVVAIQ